MGVGGIDVGICQDDPTSCGGSTTTAADGSFTIRGVVAGTYYAMAIGESPRNYLNTWYAGATSTSDPTTATSFTVAGNTSGINIKLAPGLTVSGTVTDGTNPVADVNVEIQGPDASANATTDAGGHYVVGGLKPGSNVMFVRPPAGSIFMAGYVSGGTVVEGFDGEPFDLSANLTGRDVALVTGNTLSGHISGLTHGGRVTAAGDFAGYALDVAPNGDFAIPALWPDVQVQLIVEGAEAGGFDEQFPVGVYDGTPNLNIDQSTAVAIDMSGGDVSLDLTAPVSVSVQGHITGADSVGVQGWVNLCGTGGCATSNIASDGGYAFFNLPDDSYTMVVVSFDHLDGYVTTTGVSPDQTDADPIVVSGTDVTRDVVLPAGYTISGRVTGPTGNPVANASVAATHTSHEFGRSAVTDSGGYYAIRGLRADDYVVGANGPDNSDFIQGEHYWSTNGVVSNFDTAGVVTLPATATFITGTSPSNGATGVSKPLVATVQFSDAVLGVSGTTVRLHPLGSTKLVTATVTYDAVHHVATLVPKSKLHGKTTYVLEVSGVTDTGSTAIAPLAVQFTTSK